MIIDTHAHLICDALYPRIDEIIEQAKQSDVEKILIICTDVQQGEIAIDLAKKNKMFDVAIGFHPSDLYDVNDEDWLTLHALLQSEYVVAVGEIGLDYHWKDVDKDTQKAGFIKQIKLANELHKPILIHMREATQDTIEILKQYSTVQGIMHCFSGSEETAKILLGMQMYISFGGPLTFKNAKGLPDVAKAIPMDRLFVETDCPYLTPHPFRGKQNEPKYITYTFDKLCEIKQINKEQLAKQMRLNYQELFYKDK